MSNTHQKKIEGMRRNLKWKTSRDIDQWLDLLEREGPSDASPHEAWLKARGLGHFQVRLVLTSARERSND